MTPAGYSDNDTCWPLWQWSLLSTLTMISAGLSDNDPCRPLWLWSLLATLTMISAGHSDNDPCWPLWQWPLLATLTMISAGHSDNDPCWPLWQWPLLVTSDNDPCWSLWQWPLLATLTMTPAGYSDNDKLKSCALDMLAPQEISSVIRLTFSCNIADFSTSRPEINMMTISAGNWPLQGCLALQYLLMFTLECLIFLTKTQDRCLYSHTIWLTICRQTTSASFILSDAIWPLPPEQNPRMTRLQPRPRCYGSLGFLNISMKQIIGSN